MTMRADDLVARTRGVDQALDLVSLSGADGFLLERSHAGLAGRGRALDVPVGEVDAILAAIEVDDEVRRPGCGPVAFGALPFRTDASTTMVVPEIVWGRDADGTSWVTTIRRRSDTRPQDVADLSRAEARRVGTAPATTTVAPTRSEEWWCQLVATATQALRSAGPDGLQKVVLAREVTVTADEPFDRATIVEHLRAAYPDCFIFHVDGFVGASPELLVSRRDADVRAQPMAGTAPRGGDALTDQRLGAALLESPTYRAEHQITIDMVYDTLLPWCSYLDYEAEPSVVGVANVQHLATLVEGRLSQPTPSILELVTALHPTPAVNGWPRDLAYQWIADHEGIDRGRYAGAVGWTDSRGNGTWAVSIRCADVSDRTARLVAGNGIVADSDPATELAETQAKLQAMLSALVRA